MSWLLVAFIPGLLMLATFGLDRLEAGLAVDTAPADHVDQLVEHVVQQAKVEPVPRPAVRPHAGPQGTLPHRSTRLDQYAMTPTEAYLPTRVYVHHASNPQFQPTRQSDRV